MLLYSWHATQEAALTPVRLTAEAHAGLLRHPLNFLGYTLAGRVWAAACEVYESTTRPHVKPSFDYGSVMTKQGRLDVVEEIVERRPFCDLLHFNRPGAAKDDPKLLIVAPMSGHHATLLRDTVAAMLADHDVYITDWRDARLVPLAEGGFDLDDYIDHIVEFLHVLGPNTHVMGVCQPSVPVLAASALMAEAKDPCQPASMVLMGGPIDTRINPTAPNKFAQSHSIDWLESCAISRVPLPHPGFMRAVYPGFLQLSGFMTMNLDRHIDAHVGLFRDLIRGDGDGARAHHKFYDEYLAVMDLPAEFYLQTVQRIFQEHQLARGVLESRGRKIDCAAIERTALMTVEGERDDISGPGQTAAAHELCARIPNAKRAHHLQAEVGHYGVFNGRRWREQIAPKVKAFIRANDRAR